MVSKKKNTTRSRKASTAKATTVKSTTAKPVETSAVAPVVGAHSAAPVMGVTLGESAAAPAVVTLNKKALFERMKKHGLAVKGSDARVVMDAVLAELGAALAAGETIKIQPLGNLRVVKKKEIAGADLITCKLRRKKAAPESNDPLAEAAE